MEVAKLAGVSRTTVSFVLNNTPGKVIPEETRARVLEAINTLNYVPNDGARKMAKTTYRTIGLIISHSGSVYSDAYILRLLEGIGPVLNKHRQRLILLPVRQEMHRLMDIVSAHNLDGVLITNLRQQDIDLQQIREIHDGGIPMVVIGDIPGGEFFQIDIDNREAAAKATGYLADLGHNRIAMIVHSALSYVAARARLAGYQQVLDDRDLATDPDLVRIADFTEESGYRAMQTLLALPARPTAVFAGNDAIAWGATQAIKDAKLRIPEDISIVGFDDDYPSRFMDPPLTCITVPAASLGERATRMVVDLQAAQSPESRKIQVPVFLTIRQSAAPPPKNH